MDIKIRDHIIHNFKGDDYEALKRAIDESVKEQDEVTLPGLGVFFELVWENATNVMKDDIIKLIEKRVNEGKEMENEKNT